MDKRKTETAGSRKRAMSDAQKQEKRARILLAAETAFTQKPYHEISMAGIAREANVAKGTLYLYFETKEDLFLAFYEEAFARWGNIFSKTLSQDGNFTAAIMTACKEEPLFTQLNSLLHPLIEDILPLDRVMAFKQRTYEPYVHFRAQTMKAVGLNNPIHGDRLLRGVLALMIGLKQMEAPSALRKMIEGSDAAALIVDFEAHFKEALEDLVVRSKSWN